VDGDGKLDIIACDRVNNRILVYRNISTSGTLTTNSFAPPVAFAVGADPRYMRVADLDGDGRPDIIAANYADSTISILRNIGVAGSLTTNSFAPAVNLPAGTGAYDVAFGDLDGDGKPDIAVVNQDGLSVSVYRNLAVLGVINTNSFAPRVDLAAPGGSDTIRLGDVDGDGKMDLVIGSWQSQTISVYRNISDPGALGTNSFAPRIDFATAGRTHTVALGDLNGDAKPDIALVTELNSAMSVFQNLSTPGSFTNTSLASRVDFATGYNAWGISVGDLDGDGRPDIVFCNTYDNTISICQNVMPFGSLPTITSQPISQSVLLGCDATFNVIARGTKPLSYQWNFNGTNIVGATNISLTLTNVQTSDFGSYSVVVTNVFGSMTSSPAQLALGHPPVANGDTVYRFASGGVRVNVSDLLANDTDPDVDSLSIIGVSPSSAAGGVVGLTNNWIYYAPPGGSTNGDTFTYTVSDGHCGTDVGTVTVQIKADNPQPLTFAIANPGDGSIRLTFDGMPGYTYQIEYTDNLSNPIWQTLTTQTADGFGGCQFVDGPLTNAPVRFYRASLAVVLPH
jgi:hypothetical protein